MSADAMFPAIAASKTAGPPTPGLIGWYEVRPDLITLAGSDISQINNRVSGGANPLVQAVGGAQPVYSATSWGGTRPGATFDGVADLLTANGLATSVTGTDQPFTVVLAAAILTLGSIGSIRSVWGFGRDGVDTPLHDLRLPASVSGVIGSGRRDDATSAKVKDAAATVDTNRHIYTLTFTGTKVALHVDGVIDTNLDGVHATTADSDVGAVTLDTFSIGAITRIGVSGYTHLLLGGMLVYASALNSTNRLRAEKYLRVMHPTS